MRTKEKDLPDYNKIGTYTAGSEKVKATLEIYSANAGKENQYYFADTNFSAKVFDINKGVEFESSVSLHYAARSSKDWIIKWLKINESHIEELLQKSTFSNNWRENREIMKCILSLEEQVMKQTTIL